MSEIVPTSGGVFLACGNMVNPGMGLSTEAWPGDGMGFGSGDWRAFAVTEDVSDTAVHEYPLKIKLGLTR